MIIVVAITLILIGIFFFARSIGFVDQATLEIVWPLMLVVLGLGILGCANIGHKCKGKKCLSCEVVDFSGKGVQKKKRR